jgi:hypothetical protein
MAPATQAPHFPGHRSGMIRKFLIDSFSLVLLGSRTPRLSQTLLTWMGNRRIYQVQP